MGIDFDPDDPLGNLDDEMPEGTKGSSLHVETLAGFVMPVLNAHERDFYNTTKDRYSTLYAFEDPSDMADLDRILTMELMVYRYSRMLGQGVDALGITLQARDMTALQKAMGDTANNLSRAKDALGLSRTARESDAADDVATYIRNLLQRAKAFGIFRNEQVNKGIALTQEVISVAQTWLRSNDFERSKFGYRTAEDVLQWIATQVAEEMDEIDERFRETEQKNWVGEI